MHRVGQRGVAARVAHRHRAAVPAAVAGRRDLADVAPFIRIGSPPHGNAAESSKVNRTSACAIAWAGAVEQRVAADERRRLAHLHREAQTGFPRRLVGRQLGAPRATSGLDAQRVDRVVPGIPEAEFARRLRERVVERKTLVGRDVELVARVRRRSSSARRERARSRRRSRASSRTACRPSTGRPAKGAPSSASAFGPHHRDAPNTRSSRRRAPRARRRRCARSIHAAVARRLRRAGDDEELGGARRE